MGKTWGNPTLLRYEEGGEFDPQDPFNPGYLQKNQAYRGSLVRREDGSLLLAAGAANIPDDAPDTNPYGISAPYLATDARNIGGMVFVGHWNAAEGQYDWTGSERAWVPRHVSSRGLAEPSVAELTDGRLLTTYRCSNANLGGFDQPGRKRFTISTDGGQTLSEPAELTYDDGSRFYSPSSWRQLIRHSVTGTQYSVVRSLV